MKVSNEQILGFINTTNNFKGKRLPLKLSFAIKLNIDKVMSQANAYNEEIGAIRVKYTKKENDDGTIEFTDPKAFEEEWQELLKLESDINITMVDSSVVEKSEEEQFDTLTLGELEAIYFMINE